MDQLIKVIIALAGSASMSNIGTLLLAVSPFLPGTWGQIAMALGTALLGKSIAASNAHIADTNKQMAEIEAER